MSRKIHPKTKIFFKDPYVVRIDHNDRDGIYIPAETNPYFRELKTKTYKLVKGTWGYSLPQFEKGPNDKLDLLASLFTSNMVLRSYWCFEDELDALQFRLMIGEPATHVHVWPEKYFT